MQARSTRRAFIRSSAAAGLGLTILRDSRSARSYAANERLSIALIGCGGRGAWYSDTVNGWGRLAFICDVDDNRCRDALKKHADIPRYYDFRKMLDEVGKQIDGVIVAVPDHTHAVASAAAMHAGKPVFCEKPLTRTVGEARAIAEMAAKLKIVTQMGNQGGYNPKAINLVRAGVLGDVTEVHMFNTGGGPGPKERPTDTPPVPEGLNWDLWLGPAAYRPYHRTWMQGGWRDFRTGVIGNWCPHTMATTYKALAVDTLWAPPAPGKRAPIIRVTAECSEVCKENFPRWEVVHWEVPARGEMPAAKLNWYNGGAPALEQLGHRKFIEDRLGRKLDWGDAGQNWSDWQGNLLVGAKGMLYTRKHGCAEIQLLPVDKFPTMPEVPNALPEPLGRPAEPGWTAAIRGGTPGMCSFDGFAGAFSEFYLLGNVATTFPGETLEYDPIAGKIINHKEADAALGYEYRQGWTL